MTGISFAEVRIPVALDRERTMFFNLNTMAKYEEVTGKFYFDTMLTVFSLFEAAQEAVRRIAEASKARQEEKLSPTDERESRRKILEVVRQVPMIELRALIYAAVHEYDSNNEPTWPLSLAEIGRLHKPFDMPRILTLIVNGHTGNSPTRSELGEASAATQSSADAAEAKKDLVNGGAASSALSAADFV